MLCKPEQPELLLLLLSNSSEAYCVQYNGNKRASSIVALWQSSGCYANDICILRQGIKGLLICLGHLVIHKQCQCHTQCSLGSSSSSYLVLAAPLFLLGCGYLPPHSRECMNGCRNPQLPRPLVVYTYSLFFSSLQQTWSPAKKGEHQHVSASSFREKPWHKSRAEAELAAASLASASTEPEAATRSIEHCCSAPYPLYHPADEAAAAATVVEPFKFW